jgi:hypothetical protein
VNREFAGSPGGLNYGWRCYEGFHPHVTGGCGVPDSYVSPLFEYDHGQNGGQAVTGGYVYRGAEFPALRGYYFVADYVSGRFWAWGGCGPSLTPLGRLVNGANPSSFGEAPDGELYVADLGGAIYHLVGPEAVVVPPFETPLFLPLIANGGSSC